MSREISLSLSTTMTLLPSYNAEVGMRSAFSCVSSTISTSAEVPGLSVADNVLSSSSTSISTVRFCASTSSTKGDTRTIVPQNE